MNGTGIVEMPSLDPQADHGTAILGARHLGSQHFREATVLGHVSPLPPRKDL
jgi:hypothetical protein